MTQSLGELIDEITIDAHDVDEQLSGFLQTLQDEVAVPVPAFVLGIVVDVVGFDLEGDGRRGLVAQCRHAGVGGTLSLADVRFKTGSVAAWLHAAYRTWLGLPPFPAQQPSNWRLQTS
jgi:hypothetical protein